MRHGTLAMATTGRCHEECCQPVAAAYYKRYALLKAQGHRFTVPVDATLRKVQALQRLGHPRARIAAEAGMTPQALSNALAHQIIKARTAARLDAAYRVLEMVVPEENRWTKRARREAEEAGWLPPLAYDDIEQGIVAEVPGEAGYSHKRLDADLVDYVMQYHDFGVRLSPLEKAEVVRRWTRSVGSEASLCRLTGWREGRYR